MSTPAPTLPPPLLALTPGDATERDAMRVARAVRDARAAGLGGVLLREPGLADASLLALARELRALLPRGEAWLAVHDRVHVARAAGADAVHLGFRSLPPREARRAAGEGLGIGLSTHAGDGAEFAAGADYLFHGPLHATPSKEGILEPIGFDGLAEGVRALDRPVWAIGGVRPQDIAPALAAGAAGVAVLSGILANPRPGAAAERYLEALAAAGRSTAEPGEQRGGREARR